MPRPSYRCSAAASAWSPARTRPGRATAPGRSSGGARGGRRTAAATGSRPARATGRPQRRRPPNRLASRPVVAADAQVQVHPAALPLDLIDLALAVVLTVMLYVVPGLGAGRLAPAGRVTPVLAGRLGGVPCG
jgi:hypothetical protein